MNLDADPRSERFRAEVRAWLISTLPDPPLPSVNSARDISAARVACADAAHRASVLAALTTQETGP